MSSEFETDKSAPRVEVALTLLRCVPFVATAEGVVVADLGLEVGESMGLGCCCEVGAPPENRVKHWTTSV